MASTNASIGGFPSPPLNITIIGAGLAGLLAATVLRSHHNVTIYERSPCPSIATGGQGIVSFPNGSKILSQLGFSPTRVGSVAATGFSMLDKEGRVGQEIEMDVKGTWGGEWLCHRRGEFREELVRLATGEGGEGRPARVVWGKSVMGLDVEEGRVRFEDGEVAVADLVIVADGIHSRLRADVLGHEDFRIRRSGLNCYRIAAEAKVVQKELGYLPKWWSPPGTTEGSFIGMEGGDGTKRSVAIYPLSHYEFVNISCIYPTPDSMKAREGLGSWYADGDREDLLRIFGDFNDEFVKILRTATEVKVWELQDLDPLPTWTRGRAILIGDAAHAMTPLNGQGANMSTEDAEAMRLFLQPGVDRDDVQSILQRIDAVRRPRATQVLYNTRAVEDDEDGEEAFMRTMDYNFRYDGVFKALEDAGL